MTNYIGQIVDVRGYSGVAIYIDGPAVDVKVVYDESEDDDGIWYADSWYETVVVDGMYEGHMVGDDQTLLIDESDIIGILDSVCSCGQTGCGWG